MRASVSLAGLVWLLVVVSTANAADKIEFNRDVRAILADKCFHCHGPDAAHRKAELRLDRREEALSAKAFVPGDAAASSLVERIDSDDPNEVMPPPSANKKLTAAERAILRAWIEQGAEYQGHWAFIPPVRAALPPVDASGAEHPIDRFVRERLRREMLEPAPEADRATLIRRVSLDLTGIPPTPEEVDAYLVDKQPGAYERVVDRLLASPRYGERMAVQWLDYARYADSNGFQVDSSRQMWRWREWVIDAFNRNVPFDRFTIEQLAGDMLPEATEEQVIATGFHRNTRLNGEGGRIAEEWFAETIIDRVDTTGQTWLGLTVGCARCHDHKYDPITQKEFYQLFAFFNSVDESGVLDSEGGGPGGGNSRPILPVPTPEQRARVKELEGAVAPLEARIAAARSDLPALQREWELQLAAKLKDTRSAWQMLEPKSVVSSGGATLTRQSDGSWLASGTNPAQDTYTVVAPLAAGELTALRLEAIPDASLPTGSLGRAFNGNYVLTGFEAEIAAPSLEKPISVVFVRAEADYEQANYGVAPLVDPARKNKTSGWAIDGNNPARKVARKAMFVAATPVAVPVDAALTVRLRHESGFGNHAIGRFRLDASNLPPAAVKLEGSGIPEGIRVALEVAPETRSPAQKEELAKYFEANGDTPYRRATTELAEVRKQIAGLREAFPTTMVMKELPTPREAFVLKRGEYDKPGDKVSREFPAALPQPPAEITRDRLGLAKWLVSESHPLTARVWVNRQWERLFGTGLVKTIDNFGVQSEPPSHPELLDWLATEFVRTGWDMKGMQKLIVTSATYRQSSRVTPALLERDPLNRLLARGARFRLPAEVVRDQALAVSGLLVEKRGGPSVRPYMPEGVWDETSKYGDLRGYKHDVGEGLYRRSLYTVWKRTAAPPTMLMFDSPSREVCSVGRSRTNTPLQALALLNEVSYVEAARGLAQLMLARREESASQRIAWAFRRTTCRVPESEELRILVAGHEKRVARYRADAEGAKKLVAVGELARPAELDVGELAAYTLTANVLLNLDEVVTKE